MRRDRRPRVVKLQPPNAGRVQSIAQPRLRDQHRRAGIRQHEAQTLARVAGVERQIGAAGLEDGDERNHQLQRALQAHPHHALRTNPERAQVMRQLVGATLKLPIAELLIPKHDRNRVRRLGRLRRKQLRQRRTRQRTRRRVPIPQQRATLPSRQNVQPTNRNLGRRHRALQQPNQPSRQRLHARPLEQVAGIFHHPAEPPRTPIRGALLRQAHRQVELRARPSNRLNPRAQPFKLERHRRVVLQRQHHLEQRMVRQRARRVERLNQPLKRKLLMAVRSQIARTHPPNQIAEARMAGRVRAQHQRVDEKADQILQRTVRAPRNRAADRDVVARTKPAQQRSQPSLQLRRKPKLNTPPAIARHRRPRTVARQRNLLRQPRQPLAPVRKLPTQHAASIALLPQQGLLPQRVIRVLHLKRRKIRRSPAQPRPIAKRKVPRQRTQRPAVPSNVMQQQKQNVLTLTKRKQMRSQRHLARKIKPSLRRCRQRSRKLNFTHRAYQKPHARRAPCQNLLPRYPKPLGEDRAQALVAPNNIPKRSFQRPHIQFAAKPNRQRDRVAPAPAFQPLQKPQPALPKRQRHIRRTRNRTQRRPRRSRIPQPINQRRYRRRFKQAADR